MRWSWNDDEDDALQGLRPQTQVMYLRGMRRHMDYATGYVGYKRRISYQSLAECAQHIPDHGAHERATPMTKKAARCAVDELERAGLVQRVSTERSLVLFLPFADTDTSAQKGRGTRGAHEGHTPEGHAGSAAECGVKDAEGQKEGHTPDEGEGHPSGTPELRVNVSPNGDTSAAGPPPCPHEEIIALYHEILPMCPRVRRWTDTRKAHLRGRWREAQKHQSLDFWRGYFEYVAQSPFLTGKVEPAPGRSTFVATLEWLVKSSNFVKVVEGHYHRE